MLLLLQKKLRMQHERYREWLPSLFFVATLHGIILLTALAYTRSCVLTLSLKKGHSAQVRWVTSSGERPVQRSVPHVAAQVAKKAHPVRREKSMRKALMSPLKLENKKKKKSRSWYMPPQPPQVKPAERHEILDPVRDDTKVGLEQPQPSPDPLELSLAAGSYEKELELLADALRASWHLPVGIRPEQTCTVQVRITAQGTVAQLELLQSSGVPVYDISAKTAVLNTTFPKMVWGKECVFHF